MPSAEVSYICPICKSVVRARRTDGKVYGWIWQCVQCHATFDREYLENYTPQPKFDRRYKRVVG